MPLDSAARVVAVLAERGYNADPEAVTLIATAENPDRLLDAVLDAAPDDALRLSADHVRSVRDSSSGTTPASDDGATARSGEGRGSDTGARPERSTDAAAPSDRPATDGAPSTDTASAAAAGATTTEAPSPGPTIEIGGDVTGRSTGTGTYADFVTTFRDRLDRLSRLLRPRVAHRPASAIAEQSGGTDAAIVGLVNDIRTTSGGHQLVEVEDTTGAVPCLFHKDRDPVAVVDDLLLDEVIAVEGRLADDGGLLFVDAVHFPDVPRTRSPSTADRPVSAALVSDLHVGSREFRGDAWDAFVDWLGTTEAERIEYLLIAGDMVEGVGVYPGQDEELSIVDVYDQYDRFTDRMADVPDRIRTVLIPGNHDAVRLAEPQPGFDGDLGDRLAARLPDDARITGNPSTVTIEGVTFLLYHGVSLDEVIAELPDASYEAPDAAMTHLLRKRHLAPQYGGRTRIAPEDRDYLVIEDVPDVFHAGHVHKLGASEYHGVRVLNTGCWQSQTAFQRQVNIDPDAGYAAVVDLDTLDVTIRSFG